MKIQQSKRHSGLNVRSVRCAIYTRKSCEDGLEQDFNSLDAQRLSAENYIASQTHENWQLIPKHYDDGGFSGGNMDRPALQELFEDVKHGLIDMVVVYKIDRLSRSIFDFAKIVELFNKHNVSFVSVTQSFNTSTSSGKLMLNMLLSFAQYERELTGERIRDKFASSLKKGLWMGGVVMLGYEVKDRKLLIKSDEAEIIRLIYKQFLASESCVEVAHLLNKLGHRTKVKRLKTGETSGGQMFERKAVERILKNPYYRGCVTHKGAVYQGEHEAIIDEETWNAAQEIFKKNAAGPRKPSCMTPSFLNGIIHCNCGALMKHTCSRNHGLVYRYYTCYNQVKYKNCPSTHKNIPAEPVERSVIEEVLKIIKSPEVIINLNRLAEQRNDLKKEDLMTALKNLNEAWNYLYQAEQEKIVRMLVDSIEMKENGIKLHLNLDGFDNLFVELSA
ncbi:MAG: recombinase family protein [Holosporaceae bacterium]|nr:recombinase family protein [Holosporaceae bacterium]